MGENAAAEKLQERQVAAFKKDLKKLLDKHEAYITFSVEESSDTHGLSGECIEVVIDRQSHTLSDGWAVEGCDLEPD